MCKIYFSNIVVSGHFLSNQKEGRPALSKMYAVLAWQENTESFPLFASQRMKDKNSQLTIWNSSATNKRVKVFSFPTFPQQPSKQKTNLHREENLVLSLELGKNGNEVRPEESRNRRPHVPIEPDGIGLEPLEFFGHNQAFFAHLFLPSPYRQTREGGRPGGATMECELVI